MKFLIKLLDGIYWANKSILLKDSIPQDIKDEHNTKTINIV